MRFVLGCVTLLAWTSLMIGCGGGSEVAENKSPPAAAPAAAPTPAPAAPAAQPSPTPSRPSSSSENDENASIGASNSPPPSGPPAGKGKRRAGPGYVPSDDDESNDNANPSYPSGFDPSRGITTSNDDGGGGGSNPRAGGGNPGNRGEPKPTTFDGFARQAFQQGHERDAMRYLYGWNLTSDTGAAEMTANYQWVPALRRPMAAVRWGIGVQVTTPPKFTGDVKPIGTTQNVGTKNRRKSGTERGGSGGETGRGSGGYSGSGGSGGSEGSGPSGSGGSAPGGSSPQGGNRGSDDQVFAKYAGEFADKFMQEFQNRVAEGKFGKVLAENMTAAPAGRRVASFSSDSGDSGSASPSGGSAPSGSGPSGSAPSASGPSGSGPSGGGSGRSFGAGAAARVESAPVLSRGLVSLGTASAEKDLIQKAVKENVDILGVLRVDITVNKLNIVATEIELVLIDVANAEVAKPLFRTDTLSNVKIELARQQNKDDGLDKELKKLFDFVDKNLVMSPMPDVKPEIVKSRRVDMLLEETYDNPLAVLSEIRFFNRQKLLSDEDTMSSFTRLVGDEAAAKSLIDGSEEDRKKAIERWIPAS